MKDFRKGEMKKRKREHTRRHKYPGALRACRMLNFRVALEIVVEQIQPHNLR